MSAFNTAADKWEITEMHHEDEPGEISLSSFKINTVWHIKPYQWVRLSQNQRQTNRAEEEGWRNEPPKNLIYQLLLWKLETSHIISFNISPF